ncbi:MAG: multicopper oxidase domain-containing protein [Gammaproteobacteria bacterium]
MKPGHCLPILLAALAASAGAQAAAGESPRIATHDNLAPAGQLAEGVLSLSLWAGMGEWHPEGEAGAARRVAAFGEAGRSLLIPSPLIRVPEGTTVHASVRNALTLPMQIHGLCDRPGPCEPVTIPPGETRDLRFALKAAGTFHYWASTSHGTPMMRLNEDSQLGGAIVVDASGADARDRIFVMGLIKEQPGRTVPDFAVFNGRSWPHTERLRYAAGDTVRWRVLNLSNSSHAMHLHGFFFHVESEGDGVQDNRYPAADRRLAVTEYMPSRQTITMNWVPERPGNWLFHCHMFMHMMPADELHGGSASTHSHDTTAAGMAGLVLGIEVTGAGRGDAVPDDARRKLRLVIEPDDRHGAAPAYKVNLVASPPAPRVSDRAAPGPIMVLARGEPVAVEIDNRLSEPTAIHWHGIELESYDDGVPGYGATDGRVTPPVEPGKTFTARFTPSRAGTFIYHTHWHNAAQLAAGIYGPLVVLEPGQAWDPATDHLIVLGLDGPNLPRPEEPFVINGARKPQPLDLKAGVAHRLRIINITPDNTGLFVQLLSRFDPAQWTPVAKDGSDLPPAQRTARAARQQVAVGETYDFELAPMQPQPQSQPGGLWLELRRGTGEIVSQWPVRVQ